MTSPSILLHCQRRGVAPIDNHRRQLTLTPTGVIAEETADDPAITQAIRDNAIEVTGFVRDGMPAMMQQMMMMMMMMMMGLGGMMAPR